MTSRPVELRSYREQDAAVIFRTRDRFGELSNMAGGMPLELEGIKIRSAEAYYQALRFPHLPEVQERILNERSPMMAKRVAYESLNESRPDWDAIKVRLMRFALRVKHAHHPELILDVLRTTAGRPIVEKSFRDLFWGAAPRENQMLVGRNVLGRLWMELRAELELDPDRYAAGVADPDIPDHLLLGVRIGGLTVRNAQLASPFCDLSVGQLR